MLPSIQPDKLQTQRDALLAEIQANEDWALLNSMGALPESLEFDLTHEQINEGILVEGDSINVFIKHITTGNVGQENGTNVRLISQRIYRKTQANGQMGRKLPCTNRLGLQDTLTNRN